ncbi:MAG: hypothetical protein LBE74_08000 [Treponema sp.]|jgi:hypothetical protein|nr:hypothetical protein [Treponema sp.]
MSYMKDDEFRSWADNLIAKCETNKDVYSIPGAAVTPLRPLWNAYDAALARARAPDFRSKAATRARNDAKRTLNRALTVFIAKYIDNNDAIREDLGVDVKDTTWTPIPEPTTYPEFYILVKAIRAGRASQGYRKREQGETLRVQRRSDILRRTGRRSFGSEPVGALHAGDADAVHADVH